MGIIYPYNEILPKKRAHDIYLVNTCHFFAKAGIPTTLLCGKGSLESDAFFSHYGLQPDPNLVIQPLPIIRKNNLLNLSWNLPYFYFTQRYIEKQRPDLVFLSVLKQGAYHLRRKVPGVKYIYEVHEIHGHSTVEKQMLAKADLITVTTYQLKEILRNHPYQLKNPIRVVPLAVKTTSLPPPTASSTLRITYVGQLYEGQGIGLLLDALSLIDEVQLTIIGGNSEEVARFQKKSRSLGLEMRVKFLGFCQPASLSELVKHTDVFVAPFENVHRMPYVAHTKLLEYAEWGRPIIAPDLPIVREHFTIESGASLFKPGDPQSLAMAIQNLKNEEYRLLQQQRIASLQGRFSWEKRTHNYIKMLNEAFPGCRAIEWLQ